MGIKAGCQGAGLVLLLTPVQFCDCGRDGGRAGHVREVEMRPRDWGKQ